MDRIQLPDPPLACLMRLFSLGLPTDLQQSHLGNHLLPQWSHCCYAPPLYRAVGPGRTHQWWWITAILLVLIVEFYIAVHYFGHADFPNLAIGLLAPAGGVIAATM